MSDITNEEDDSFHFCYAFDKDRIYENPLPHSLSMIHFKETMEKMKSGLDYLEAGVDLEWEGRAIDAEMEAEMNSYLDY